MKKILGLAACSLLLIQCGNKDTKKEDTPDFPLKINTRYHVSDIRSATPDGGGLLMLLPIVTDSKNFSFELVTPDSMYTYTGDQKLMGYMYKYSGDTLTLLEHSFITKNGNDGEILMISNGTDTTVVKKPQ